MFRPSEQTILRNAAMSGRSTCNFLKYDIVSALGSLPLD